MEEKFLFEGKTSTEAIEKGLKTLKVSKDEVEITILKDEKRSFFSILEPRVVKIEMKLKETKEPKVKKEKVMLAQETIQQAEENVDKFLKKFLVQIGEEPLEYKLSHDEYYVYVAITGKNTNVLIGYRGETLNALQTLLTAIANQNVEEKVRVILDISGYKEKRKKVLEELADKLSKTVMRTGKRVTLEPMPAYERKIIHSRLQNNSRITTTSIGDEPHRKIVIDLKKKK